MGTFQWITALTTDLMLRDVALDMGLSRRIDLVCQLIGRSTESEEKKARAVAVWREVSELSKIRNKVAHSPMVPNPNGSGEWAIIDVKKMKGPGPYALDPLHFDEIAVQGSRLAKLLPELLKPFGPNVPDGKGGEEPNPV